MGSGKPWNKIFLLLTQTHLQTKSLIWTLFKPAVPGQKAWLDIIRGHTCPDLGARFNLLWSRCSIPCFLFFQRCPLFASTIHPSVDSMCPSSNSFVILRIGFCCLQLRNFNPFVPFKGHGDNIGERLQGSWGGFYRRYFRGQNHVTKEITSDRKGKVVKSWSQIFILRMCFYHKGFSFELSPRWAKKTGCMFLINGSTAQTILRPNIWGWIIFACFSLHWDNHHHGLWSSWFHCSTSRTHVLPGQVTQSPLSLASFWMGEPRLWVSTAQSQQDCYSVLFSALPQGSKRPTSFL